MPDDRLERTRNPQPTVPACVRLDHLWRVDYSTGNKWCARCHLVITRLQQLDEEALMK